MSTASEKEDCNWNCTGSFALPETVLCVDTICHICYAEFLDEDDLRLHITQQHTSKETFCRICQFCSYFYASLDEYASHIINVHILDLKSCKYCLRVFTNGQDVKGHEKKHLSSNSTLELNCSNCTLTFKNVSSLERHESSEHDDIKDGVILKDCYALLSSYLNMNASIFLKSLGESREYKCVSCIFITSDVDYYIQHLQQKNCRCLVCDKCCHVFKNIKTLKTHFKTICWNKDLNLPCKKCLAMFKYDDIEEHMKICNGIKFYSCDDDDSDKKKGDDQTEVHPMRFSVKSCKLCHHEYVGQDALNKHIKRTHGKDLHLYKYFCIYCKNTIFNHPKKLFNHFYRKHRDLEPFTCKICNQTFRMRKHFTLHIKLIHLSVGNVRFDDKYHVIFTQNNFSTPNLKENKNKEEKKDEMELNENVKDKPWNDKIEILLSPIENKSKHNLKEKLKEIIQGDSEVDLVLCPTDKETEQPEKKKEKRLIKRKRKMKIIDLTLNDSEDSDDEPLTMKRRRAKMRVDNIRFPKWLQRSKLLKRDRVKFTCKICKKYCYTYQNFQHHMTLHKNNLSKKCIKCPEVFKTTEELNRHISNQHSTSKLTETLKNVLERRKQTNYPTEIKPIELERKYISEKFSKTIKKVNINASDTSVRIKPVIDRLSVRKFIENFTPESGKENTIYINNSLTIKPIIAPEKPPLIKLIKSKIDQPVFTKLKQPERFRTKNKEQYEISIKLAEPDAKPKMNFHQVKETVPESVPTGDTNDDSMDSNIPEVAEEIMLDDTLELPNDVPKLPQNYSFQGYKDLSLAHLTTTAPYYKIVKVKDLGIVRPEAIIESREKQIKLPDGTKLVSVNPLAHLLRGKQVDLKTNKYYKSKLVDVEKAVATALLNSKTKHKKPKKTKVLNEQ